MGRSIFPLLAIRGTAVEVRDDVLGLPRWADAYQNGLEHLEMKVDPDDQSTAELASYWSSYTAMQDYLASNPDLFDISVNNSTVEYSTDTANEEVRVDPANL